MLCFDRYALPVNIKLLNMLLKFMKQTSTNSGATFNKHLALILTVLNFPFYQFILSGLKNKVYTAFLNNALKSILVCMALGLMPAVTKADTPIPTSVMSSYDAALQRLTMTINWTWGSNASNKHVGAAVFADLNGDGITPTIFDNPATYTSGGNPFPAGLQARDEFLGQLAVSTIEGSAFSSLFAGSDNTDNGIASGVSGMTSTSARLLLPYLGNSMAVVNTVTGTFTLIYNNVPVSPTKLCVVLYDPHTPFFASGGHSVTSAGPGYNTDNSIEDGNSNGTVSCTNLVVLRCAANKTEFACQTQAAIDASYAAWLASATGSGCNGVLTNNSTGAPSASGGSKTVIFTYTQNGCSNQATVTTCSATFTVSSCNNNTTLSLGNRVFNDVNNNGIDNTEAGISGATVNLYKDDNNDNVADGASIATLTTNATGNYIFTGLVPGNYIVGVVTPAGFTSSAVNGGDPDNNTDLDDNGQVAAGAETRGLAITLSAGAEPNGDINNTYDFGFYTTSPSLTLGNQVFFDMNRSGMYDAGDSVASGMIVRLYNDANNDNVPDGAFIQAASTNGTGQYSFTNLAAGNYIVGVVVPSPFAITIINGGDPDNNIDNDNNATTLVSGEARGLSITLSLGAEPIAGNTNNTYDIGLYNPLLPPNGGQNCFAGTNPLVYAKSFWNVNANSQTVTLRVTFSKKFVDNTYGTGAIGWPNGHTWGNLTGSDHLQWSIRDANGVEKLAFKQDYVSASAAFPSGFGCLGFGGDGGNPTVGLTTDVLSFRTSIASNFNDFGYVLTTNSPATDTNYTPNPAQPNWIYDVWYEVTVKASVFGTTGFGFVNVASVHASPSKTGNNTEIITNTPCVSSIGDRVWYDTDRDGIQDAGENGIRGVTVKLRNAANAVIATQVTNTTGNYLFTGLNAGTYTVEFPATVYGYILSPALVGTNRSIDSDPSVTTGLTAAIVLGIADDIRTIDAGYAPDCACTNSAGNLLINANFENGTTGWNWSGGTLTTGTGYVACGVANGFNNWSSGTSKIWQDVNVTAGSTVAFSGFAGTHAPGIACSPKLSLVFLNGANAVISQSDVTVTRIVGDYNDQIEQYSITAVAPAGTVKVRVQSTITCNTMKLDAFCLTVTAVPVGSIGDRVWNDTDGDGIQDAGEVGIAGVTLVLLNAAGQPIASTTTDAFGNYKFGGLEAGNYSVRITPPANYSLSAKTQGADTNTDSDFDTITYTTGTVTLNSGQNRTDIDAGLKFTQTSTASVGDRVWLDNNADGVQDAGEPGVSNVLVSLYNSVSILVRSTYTDVNGNYLFTDVTPGTYTIGVSLPPAFVFSPNNGAISGATNSDIVPATGRTVTFTVNAGDQITYIDAGIRSQSSTNGSIGDYVWNDINKNGIQEAGEPGIAGVTVRLFNAANAIIATTITDATGNYIFNDIPAGDYKVDFVTPVGYTTTTKLNSNVTASGTDSDVDPVTSRTAIFTLAAGQRITTVDAGYWQTNSGAGKIGDRVWLDANQNGIQDAGEANVQGMTVTLYDAANTAIKRTVTDASGNYLFTDLFAGNYTVGFSNVPAGYTFTTQGLGTAATGSDANPATGRTATITLAAGQVNLDVDAGIRSVMAGTASLGNRVWNDINNNGLQDAGEPGIQGVTVELLDAAGNPIDKDPNTAGVQPTTTITNALGEYLFTGLAAGDYKVRFGTLPAGYNASPKAAGTNRDIDSDGNTVAGGTSTTDVVSVAVGEERLDIDFGLYNPTAPLGQIGDYVWFDSNNNGVQDATEQGVPGVTVSLLDAANAVIATTVTDANGLYRFVNLANATYSIRFSNLPAGFTFSPKDLGGNDNTDSDADVTTGVTGTYTIAAGNTNLTVDAGIYSTRAALGDYVWFDANSNGIQEATEKGIPGVTVTIYDAANVAVTSAITDQNGRYFFSNLNPGTYTVGFGTIPNKLVFTTKDVVAAGDAADSDVDPATGKTGSYTLVAGQVNLTVDAGLKPLVPATVGDYVWFDLNRDGLQDIGEPGVPGVVATLYNAANQATGSAITDGNGYYLISNVPAGAGYYVVFSNKPDPAAPWTLQNVGGAAANNNSKADATGKTTSFNVSDGQNISNIDAGVQMLINIRGNVWNDANGLTDLQINRTGTQALPNSLNIYLVDVATNQVVQAESILPDGTYSFLDVEINKSYKIVLSTVVAFPGQQSPMPFLPSGWQRVGENLGAGPLSGSDGVPNGLLFIDTETSDIYNANFGIRVSGGEIIVG